MKGLSARVPGTPETCFTTHPRGHWSDLVALHLVARYGRQPVFLNRAEARRAGWTGQLIEIGRNGDFDEQDDPSQQECEAMLVAKHFGVIENPELQRILSYTLAVDTEGKAKGILKIGRVVELLYDVFPESQWHRVWEWVGVFLDAYLDDWLDARPAFAVKADEVIGLIRQAWHRVEGEFSDLEKAETAKHLARYNPRMEFEPFGLPMCVAVIWRRWKKLGIKNTPLRWAEDAIRAELVKQRMFFASAAEFAHSFMAEVAVSGKQAFVLGAETDNHRIQSFAFSSYGEKEFGNVVAVAVRRSNGQVLVCRKPRGAMVELWSAVAQIRAREQEVRDFPVSPWRELIAPRGPAGAECWFFQQEAQRLMNGALTIPDEEPTRQTLKEVWDRLVWGVADEFLGYRRQFAVSVGGCG